MMSLYYKYSLVLVTASHFSLLATCARGNGLNDFNSCMCINYCCVVSYSDDKSRIYLCSPGAWWNEQQWSGKSESWLESSSSRRLSACSRWLSIFVKYLLI